MLTLAMQTTLACFILIKHVDMSNMQQHKFLYKENCSLKPFGMFWWYWFHTVAEQEKHSQLWMHTVKVWRFLGHFTLLFSIIHHFLVTGQSHFCNTNYWYCSALQACNGADTMLLARGGDHRDLVHFPVGRTSNKRPKPSFSLSFTILERKYVSTNTSFKGEELGTCYSFPLSLLSTC